MKIPCRSGLLLGCSLVVLLVTGCGDEGSGSSTTPVASGGAATQAPPSPSPTPSVDLVKLIETIPGYTYAPSPEAEQAFASGTPPEDAPEELVVRAVLLDGVPQGNIFILGQDEPLSEQELRDSLAGAFDAGNEAGTATRTEIAGRPAVKTVRGDGGTTWSTVKGRYTVVVGALPAVVDDITTQVLDRLPGE